MKQRSPEWHTFRRGRLTASRFGDVLAKPETKRYRGYMEDVVDGLQGVPGFDDEKPWYAHGVRWEDEGIGRYEWKKNVDVERVGVVVHPRHAFISCSPDGEISVDGGLELKCRSSLAAHRESVRVGIDATYKPQVQGCLWVTGREWWDFVSYYKKDRSFFKGDRTLLHIHRVFPDEKFIARLEVACLAFWGGVQARLKEERIA